MLCAQGSQSMPWPCLHVLLLHGLGCAENSVVDFAGLPEGFVTGCSTSLETLCWDWAVVGAQQHPCEGVESHHPNRDTAMEAGQLCGGQKRFSCGASSNFYHHYPLLKSWQQLCSRWCPTGSTGLPRGWQMPHSWNRNGCRDDGICFLKVTFALLGGSTFWAVTTILKATPTHLIPEHWASTCKLQHFLLGHQ